MRRKTIEKMPKRARAWKFIHDALGDMFMHLRVYRSSKDYFRVTWFGDLKDLRRQCIRILNAIDFPDREEKMVEDGIPDTGRWE